MSWQNQFRQRQPFPNNTSEMDVAPWMDEWNGSSGVPSILNKLNHFAKFAPGVTPNSANRWKQERTVLIFSHPPPPLPFPPNQPQHKDYECAVPVSAPPPPSLSHVSYKASPAWSPLEQDAVGLDTSFSFILISKLKHLRM